MTLTKYWRFVRIDMGGRRHVEEILDAQTFLDRQFSDHELATLTDKEFQHRLLDILNAETKSAEARSLAECCLRCFISNQIDQGCQKLAEDFGKTHGFIAEDLYPYVLGDRSPYPTPRLNAHPSLISEILESYRAERGSLSSWVIRRVHHHKPLNSYLLECGVYLVSDWAILNDTNLKQLQRIFAEFYTLSELEIQQACAVLSAYHAIYRSDRIQQRLQGRAPRRCIPPTDPQWEHIRRSLISQRCFAGVELTLEETQHQVQSLAERLRDYRISVRRRWRSADSLDQPETAAIADKELISQAPTLEDDESETQRLLNQYRPIFEQTLTEALAIALDARVAKLQRRNPPVDHHYLKAMQLFHCQGMVMKEIAQHVDLEKQYQVSRLMDLTEFHRALGDEMLDRLRQSLPDLAQSFTDPDRLKALSQLIRSVIDSQFTFHLCRHLDTRSF